MNAATVAAAVEHGADRVTPITYTDIPWNGRWYTGHGRRETDHRTPGGRAVREHERAAGMDRHRRRVALVRDLARG